MFASGEIMARISPVRLQKVVQSTNLKLHTAAARLMLPYLLQTTAKTRLTLQSFRKNDIAESALRTQSTRALTFQTLHSAEERVRHILLRKGASQRASKVTYDRKYSSISMAEKADFDWKKIFDGACWFHFTGITPALSDSCAEITLEACKTAKEMGLKVSCDLNFRKKLWTSEKAGKVMGELYALYRCFNRKRGGQRKGVRH